MRAEREGIGSAVAVATGFRFFVPMQRFLLFVVEFSLLYIYNAILFNLEQTFA
jgi:hypothetical protein